MKSRFQTRGIGAQTFTTQTPTCPPGQYWVPDPAVAVRGLSRTRPIASCQPVHVVHLTLRPPVFVAPPQATPIGPPAPPPPVTVAIPGGAPNTVTVYPAPPQVDEALPPALVRAAPPAICPPVWPWWWLLVAAAAGAGAGYLIKKDKKGAKKNVGRVMNAVGGRLVNRAVSRIV
jgi:hypothetical protein